MDLLRFATAGSVDDGKSTLIGRLRADTGALPQGKLEQVKALCARNARPFEYAFLLDALKNDELKVQRQRAQRFVEGKVTKDW